MDPLSTLASILALVGTVHKSAELLGKAIKLKKAPDVLLALNNEISDLRLVLDDVNDLLLASTQNIPPKSLGSALERVKSTLLRLEKFVAHELTTFDSAGRARVDKSTFFRKGQRLHQLKNDVRADRVVLGAALSLFASFISMHNDYQLRQTHCSIGMLDDRINDLHVDRESEPAAPSHDAELVVSHDVHGERNSDPPTKIQVFKAACGAECLCTCHRYSRIRSPAFLNNVLGTLFIGYRANVSLRPACSDVACRSRANGIVCTYIFPSWLLKYAISMSQSSIPSKGPEFLLRLMRVRDFAPVQRVLENGSKSWSLDEMKRMLDIGEVSVLDVDHNGLSVLHYAVFHRKWPVARLLISYGADVNHENNDSISPFIDAWTKRFGSRDLPGDISEDWDKLFLQDRSQLDVFGFSKLHEAYLGLSGLRFDQVLACTDRSSIDKTDSLGRTVLYWAANRGDSLTVAQLLTMGADPNKQNKTGKTPLYCAVRIDPLTCKILLDAKADPTILTFSGYSLLRDIRPNTVGLIKRIVELGVNINQVGEDGATALRRACYSGESEVVRELIACGANINLRDKFGSTEIMVAILLNWHQSLSILMTNTSIDLGVINSFGWDVPMFAAGYGDVQTLKILVDNWPTGTHFGRIGEEDTFWKIARFRRDENEDWSHEYSMPRDSNPLAWFDEFETVVNSLVKRPTSTHESADPTYRDEVWEDAGEHFDDS